MPFITWAPFNLAAPAEIWLHLSVSPFPPSRTSDAHWGCQITAFVSTIPREHCRHGSMKHDFHFVASFFAAFTNMMKWNGD